MENFILILGLHVRKLKFHSLMG